MIAKVVGTLLALLPRTLLLVQVPVCASKLGMRVVLKFFDGVVWSSDLSGGSVLKCLGVV